MEYLDDTPNHHKLILTYAKTALKGEFTHADGGAETSKRLRMFRNIDIVCLMFALFLCVGAIVINFWI